jgi:hypothetical protein
MISSALGRYPSPPDSVKLCSTISVYVVPDLTNSNTTPPPLTPPNCVAYGPRVER